MPELPEVQTTVNGINKTAKGQIILDVWSEYKSEYYKGKENIKDVNYFKKFKKEIIGKKILKAERIGKTVNIYLKGGTIIQVHMKMTGHFLYGKYSYNKKTKSWEAVESEKLKDPFNRFIRLVFTLSSGNYLALCDMRKFATVKLVSSKDLENKIPDPVKEKVFSYLSVKSALSNKSGNLKNILMNPEVIHGIGNIYSDEILWKCSLHPEEKTEKLTDKDFKNICKTAKEILNSSIAIGGDSMSDYRNVYGERGRFQNKHKVYKRKNLPCLKKGCGGTIERKIIGGRSAHYCPLCQVKK